MRIGIITRQESDTETPRQAGFSCLVSYWSLAINNSPQKSAGKPLLCKLTQRFARRCKARTLALQRCSSLGRETTHTPSSHVT